MGFLQTLRAGRFSRVSNGIETEARGTSLGSLSVAQVEQPLTELTRAGRRFGGGLQIIANAFASVQAIPTTTATYLLYNNSSNKALVIDSLLHWLASGTADIGSLLMAAVSPAVIASPPTAQPTGWGVASLGGVGTSESLWQSAATIAAGAAWIGVAGNLQAAAAVPGSANAPMYSQGGIIVPPRYGLGLAVLSGAGTAAKFGVSLTWHEVDIDRE